MELERERRFSERTSLSLDTTQSTLFSLLWREPQDQAMVHTLSDPKKTWAFSAQLHHFVVPAVECAAAEADTVAADDDDVVVAAVSVTGFGAAGTVVRLT